MTLQEWDLLEEAVNALDGSWGAPENQSGGGKIVICTSTSHIELICSWYSPTSID
jgi:hypothetical protein